jgi:hypothetical protein
MPSVRSYSFCVGKPDFIVRTAVKLNPFVSIIFESCNCQKSNFIVRTTSLNLCYTEFMAPTLTHCPHGHPYDEHNTYRVPSGAEKGRLRCKRCHAERAARRHATPEGRLKLKAKRRREYLRKLEKQGRHPIRKPYKPNGVGYYEARKNLHLEFVAAYGGRCQCACGCTETNPFMLTGDHLKNNGRGDRDYKWRLKQAGWPKREDLILACFNCNCGRELTPDKKCPRLQ